MADNVSLTGVNVATDKVSYSGNTVNVQLIEVVNVTGSEGARTVDKIADATGLNVHTQPATTGGCANHHVVAAATTNAANIKPGTGQLYGVHMFNNAIYPVYAKFHDTAGTPAAGTGVVITVGCQAGQRANVIYPDGKAFSTGIGRTIVKLMANNNATVLIAGDCVLDVDYK